MRLGIDHDDAIRSQAAQGYVSHELSPHQRKEFEEHFFDCAACAQDVRSELIFAANMRSVARELRASQPPAPPPRKGFWDRWRKLARQYPGPALASAAGFAMVAGLGYLLLAGTHPAPAPRLISSYFAPGPTHGAADVHALAAGETVYQVRFPVPLPKSPSYTYEIVNASGQRESSATLKAPPSEDDSLNLQIPVENLPAGVHTLVVRGEPGGEIVSWSKFSTAR